MLSIDIEAPAFLFDKHFGKQDNKHIIFSAPFGFGKTYFLKNFFSQKEEKYNTFWLSPVKYVVGQNEDIFEYIKTDIAIQLIGNEVVKMKTTSLYSEDLFINEYFSERPKEIAKLLFESIKETDIPVIKQGAQLILNGLKASEQYDSWKAAIKETQKGEFDKLLDYISNNTKIKGSIFEEDTITKLIRLVLQAIKLENSKENILIIDDFDRLDPDHIFRILNILSVHQNFVDSEDKFGFDKIIIVCHINNIESIFKHKFGSSVDFNGYIEKFYSTDIFHFNNQATIAAYCKSSFGDELNDSLTRILGIYLSHFISRNLLNVRAIIKYQRVSAIAPFFFKEFPIPAKAFEAENNIRILRNANGYPNGHTKTIWGDNFKGPLNHDTKHIRFKSDDFPILKIIQILVTVFGDYNVLVKSLEKSKNSIIFFPKKLTQIFVNNLIPIIHLITNEDDPDKIFANISNKEYTVETYGYLQSALTLDLPNSAVLNNKITIQVGWNNSNQYSESLGYYSQVNQLGCIMESEDASHNNLQQQLIHFLTLILQYLEHNDLLKFIGISK